MHCAAPSIEANLSVHSGILEVNLRLDFFNLGPLRASQQQEVNNFGSCDGMSLQTYTANYWPGTCTTAFLVVRTYFEDAKERPFCFK